MSFTKDYGKSPAPNFDAVEDIRDWLGPERYDLIASQIRAVTDPFAFAMYCDMAGIKGFPVKAWYDHFHGEGKWADATKDHPEFRD